MILRNVRPVALTGPPPADLLDLRLEDGFVTEARPRIQAYGQEEQDAEGRWVAPGLWDAHVHLGQWTVASARLDLAGVRSAQEAVALVGERLRDHPDLPVIGFGHRSSDWPHPPLVSDLDALDTDQPVVLISGDAHHAWLNTVALHTLALPTREGVVSEGEWFAAYARVAFMFGGDETGPEAYRRTLLQAAGLGVVGVSDYEFSGGVADWLERWEAGADVLRVRMSTYADGLEEVLEAGLRTGDPLIPGDDRLTMGALKIISDGSLNTQTAWCAEKYAGPAPLGHPFGQPNQSPEELEELLARGRAHGLEAAVHAIGDRAVTMALDAFERTGATGSVEHVQLVSREDLPRMAAAGLVASVQPAHLVDDRDVADRLWPGRGARCYALRWIVDAGVRLALGSDAPVSALDPWLAMATAVHRTGDDREPWHPEQSLTAREALAASVDGQPTVGVGSRADLVLLDADPLAPPGDTDDPAAAAAHLRSMADRVHSTYVAGRPVTAD